MKNLNIEIVSVDDRDELVAEIWNDTDLIAEISQEESRPQITLYAQKYTIFVDEFTEIIDIAIKRLNGSL